MTNTFTDPRDGQTYKTVKINGQVWLGENLRYKGPIWRFNDWTIEEKNFYYPPNGDRKNINKFGCLYTWNNAIKACPPGWHLPTEAEFKTLLTYVGSGNYSTRSQNLRATTWGIGADKYGFGALPAGLHYAHGGGGYLDFGSYAFFWSATEDEGITYRAYALFLGSGYADVGGYDENYAISVRCIKDRKEN